MALAARCPNCRAMFRVTADQLKLRNGLVRCGACRHVFDAVVTLNYIDDPAPAPWTQAGVGAVIAAIRQAEKVPADAAELPGGAAGAIEEPVTGLHPARPGTVESDSAGVVAAAALEVPADDAGRSGDAAAERAAVVDEPAAANEDAAADTPEAPATDPGRPGESIGERAAAVAAAVDEGATVELEKPDDAGRREACPPADAEQSESSAATLPLPGPPTLAYRALAAAAMAAGVAATAATPYFLRYALARRRRRSPLFAIAFVLLALVLLAQLAAAFRAEILAAFPQARPALVELCKVFRCTVDWPARRDLLAVVGSDLQVRPGTDVYELTAIVRTRGSITLALPAIELTLSDTLERPVVRRVFAPDDYLAGTPDAAARRLAGLEAGADLSVSITFAAPGLRASGFVVYPFYL